MAKSPVSIFASDRDEIDLLSSALTEACDLLVTPKRFPISDIDGVIAYYGDIKRKVAAWQTLASQAKAPKKSSKRKK